MCDTAVLPPVGSFVGSVRALVVDDDTSVVESVRRSFAEFGINLQIEAIEEPEEIQSQRFDRQGFDIVVLDVMFREEKKRIKYLLRWVQRRWPNAVIVVLSNFTPQLSRSDREAADLVLNKLDFNLDRSVFIRKVAGLASSEEWSGNGALRVVADRFDERARQEGRVDLFTMTGFVLEHKGQHVEVAVREESLEGHRWRKILMLASLFKGKGLEGMGTPFILRISAVEDAVTATVDLNEAGDRPVSIPHDLEDVLTRLDEQDERLRRETTDGR